MDAALCAVHDLRAFWYLETPVEPLAFQSLLERAIRYKQSLQKNNALKRDQDLRFALDGLAEPPRRCSRSSRSSGRWRPLLRQY